MKRTATTALLLASLFVPIVLSAIYLPRHYFHRPVSDYIPNPDWNDEVAYWLGIETFRVAGMKGGYLGVNEVPAPLAFTHFSVHGPAYPIVAGLSARLLGFLTNDRLVPLALNLFWLALSFAFFFALTKPSLLAVFSIGIILSSFWPLHLYLPSISQEILHLSLGVVLAALSYEIWKRGPCGEIRLLALSSVVLAFAAWLRLSWALLWIPWFLILVPAKSLKSAALRFGVAASLIGISMVIWKLTIAPFPSTIRAFSFLRILFGEQSLAQTFHDIFENVKLFFVLPGSEKNSEVWLESFQRAQVILLIFTLLMVGWWNRSRGEVARGALFSASFLGLLLSFVVSTYFIGGLGDYRVLAGPVLFTLLFTVITEPKWGLALSLFVMLTNLIILKPFLSTYELKRRGSFYYVPEVRKELIDEGRKILKFVPSENGWCNTILTLTPLHPFAVTALVPPGMGVHAYFDSVDNVRFPFRSAYLFLKLAELPDANRRVRALSDGRLEWESGGESIQMTPVGATSAGTFYRNGNVSCQSPAS